MKLLVYDKFWDAFINLPKTTQKKVVEFQKKFRENTKSSAIHLESISTFKDKSLRSARIDQAYRAILKTPESGQVYYLLWVDHHDEAYQWATNKVFQWNEVTQSVQMFTAPETVSSDNILVSKNKEVHTFFGKEDNGKLIQLGVPEVLLPAIQKINDLPGLERIEQYIPSDVFENLFYLLEGGNIDELIAEISEGLMSEQDLEKQVTSINNQRSFVELTDDTLFNEALTGSLNKWKYYLHPSQGKLVTGNFKGPLKITGGAGTGKTVAALHRLKYLAETKKPKEKILFTTFTKALVENLTDLIKGMGLNLADITLINIDKLVGLLINEFQLLETGYKQFDIDSVQDACEIWNEIISGELTVYSPEFLEAEYKQVVLANGIQNLDEYIQTSRKGRGKPVSRRQRKEILKFFEQFCLISKKKNLYYREELINLVSTYLKEKDIHPFYYCIVDEIQDFSNIEMRFIRSLVSEKENDLFLVGDPMQRIYNKAVNFSQAGINIRGKRSRRLRINYRTSEEIKKLAISIVEDCHYDDFDGDEESKMGYVSLYHGLKPKYGMFKEKNEEIEFVLNKIQNLIEAKYHLSDIAICSRTKNGLKDFRNALHKLNLSYDDRESSNRAMGDSLSLLTFHRIKGLEFKHVFIVDVNDRNVPKLPYNYDEFDNDEKEIYLKNEKSMLYVAVSRAKENVSISGVGRKSELFRI